MVFETIIKYFYYSRGGPVFILEPSHLPPGYTTVGRTCRHSQLYSIAYSFARYQDFTPGTFACETIYLAFLMNHMVSVHLYNSQHVSSSPLHLPSAPHSLELSPLTTKPLLHVYCAMEPSVRLVRVIPPFVGSFSSGQLTVESVLILPLILLMQ